VSFTTLLFFSGKEQADNYSRAEHTPRTPHTRLSSIAPPAYASPDVKPSTANALDLDLDTVQEDSLEKVREIMLKRSYGNLRRSMGERRGRRAISAPPM
jgi:hypothetical protein